MLLRIKAVAYRIELPFKLDVGKRKIIWMQLAPSLNVQIREHFQKRAQRKEAIKELILKQHTPPDTPLEKPNIYFSRRSVHLLDPIDNMGASFKAIGDALVELGFLQDDAEECIGEYTPDPKRVARMAEQKIIIELT